MSKRTNGATLRHPGHDALAVDGKTAGITTDHHWQAVLFAALNLAEEEAVQVQYLFACKPLQKITHQPTSELVEAAQSAIEALQLLADLLGITPPIEEE